MSLEVHCCRYGKNSEKLIQNLNEEKQKMTTYSETTAVTNSSGVADDGFGSQCHHHAAQKRVLQESQI
jgi:hypothetical protein